MQGDSQETSKSSIVHARSALTMCAGNDTSPAFLEESGRHGDFTLYRTEKIHHVDRMK